MKIALCLSGLMRTYRQVYESLIEKVILPNNADLFISTWNILGTGTYKVPGQPWKAINGTEKSISEEEIRNTYGNHLKGLQIEDWAVQPRFRRELEEAHRLFAKKRPRADKSPEHVLAVAGRITSMHYKVRAANRLRQEHGDYDVVIRGRPDLRHEDVLRVKNYDLSYPNIYTDSEHNYRYICDQFAFGSPQAMDLYSSVYPWILEYHSQTGEGNKAEKVMKYYLETVNKLKVTQIKINYKTVGLVER